MCCDFISQVWTKLSGPSGSPPSPPQPTPSVLLHPSARDGHAACVIEGRPRPLMLVTGGWDAMDHALNDMWLLDVNSGIWSQVHMFCIRVVRIQYLDYAGMVELHVHVHIHVHSVHIVWHRRFTTA